MSSNVIPKENNTQSISKFCRKMHRRPFIRGVSGVFRNVFFDKHIGILDAKQNQVCVGDGQVLTPNIVRMKGCLDGYIDRTYAYAIRCLKDFFDETSILSAEIENIRERYENPITTINAEERLRQEEAIRERKLKDDERIEEIRIRAACLNERFETADEALRHHLEHAGKITNSHIASYWRGILASNVDGVELPVYPVMIDQDHEGQRTYEQHKARIGKMLENISALPIEMKGGEDRG